MVRRGTAVDTERGDTVGEDLKYLVRSGGGRPLACLLVLAGSLFSHLAGT